ncbi:MAG: hypothetical protein KJ052_15335, partial [Candidatus Hydrogenedentes bacterium]|nr:hypothetical protein [Candidatus Hydrogenedentota bacterium]
MAAVIRALETIDDGDPAFTTALIQDALPNAIASLVKTIAAKGYLAGTLLSAYRRYLMTNARQRCGHLVSLEKQVLQLPSHNYVQSFNNLVENLRSQGMLGQSGIEPLKMLTNEMRVLEVNPRTALTFDSELSRKLLKSIGELIDQRANSSPSDEYRLSRINWEKFADTVVADAKEYTYAVLSERREGNEARKLREIGHILSLILDVVDVPSYQERTAETYAKAIASLWQVGVDDDLYHAHLRRLILKCWGEGVDRDSVATLRQARLRGVRS